MVSFGGIIMTKLATIALLSSVAFAGVAHAHTTSLGYTPGGAVGSVTFWTGSYEHGGAVGNEGTFTLQGITNPAFVAVVNANVAPTGTRPGGLVDGTNNFFWHQTSGGYTFPNSTDPNLFGGVVWWQGISFTGLTPGTYSFTCGTTCGSTQQWASLSTVGGADGTVQITLTGADIGGVVPEPSTWALLILGFGAVGGALRSRKRLAVRYA